MVRIFAASSATKEEEERAAKLSTLDPKAKPVHVEKRLWRPQVTSQYKEPDCIPDSTSDLEILYKDYGNTIWTTKTELSPRDKNDIIDFQKEKHQLEFDRNIQWRECPDELQPKVTDLLKRYWDVFAEEGVRKHIRGVKFHVDTGDAEPICVKSPRYGPHESRVISSLLEKLEQNGLIEDDDGPWGAIIVLAAKPNQEHVHWSQYIWRLCVSYRKLNAITRPFAFPIIRCDDAVQAIGDRKFYITMDLDSGYWQIEAEPASRSKLAFFTPNGKKRWTVMPMGATNAHPVFVAFVSRMKIQWDKLAEQQGLSRYISQVIVDDIILAAHDVDTLLKYFECVLEILQLFRCTAKLRKCRFFVPIAEFVGLDVHPEGNAPAKSKFQAFRDLGRPIKFTDLNMLIGIFGFYQGHLPLFEVRIARWREHQKLRPPKGAPLEEEIDILKKQWTNDDDDILSDLKESILSAPILRRPNSALRFYLKTDWSKDAMGAALLQPDEDDQVALEAMMNEVSGNKCVFDLTKSGLRLYPLAFISRRTADTERSYHSYVGEACTGIWAIEKFRPYLFGREFTWLTDCSGLRKFFEGDDVPTHMIQRWRMQLLRYDFTIVHRPGRMMFECDMLSRYNQTTQHWRDNAEKADIKIANLESTIRQTPSEHEAKSTEKKNGTMVAYLPKGKKSNMSEDDILNPSPPIPLTFHPIMYTGQVRRTPRVDSDKYTSLNPLEEDQLDILTAESYAIMNDIAKRVWMFGTGMTVLRRALEDLGIDMIHSAFIGAHQHVEIMDDLDEYNFEEALEIASMTDRGPDWFVIPQEIAADAWESMVNLAKVCKTKGLQAIIFLSSELETRPKVWQTAKTLAWHAVQADMKDSLLGGGTDLSTKTYIVSPHIDETMHSTIWNDPDLKKQHSKEKFVALHEILDKDVSGAEEWIFPEDQKKQVQWMAPQHLAKISSYARVNNVDWLPVYDIANPLPHLQQPDITLRDGSILIETTDPFAGSIIRPLRWTEAARAIGLRDQDLQDLLSKGVAVCDIWKMLTIMPTRGVLRTIATTIHLANLIENTKTETDLMDTTTLSSYVSPKVRALMAVTTTSGQNPSAHTIVNRWSTIPLPTHKDWVEATAADPNLSLVMEAIVNHESLQRHELSDKGYFAPFEKQLFEVEEGILYYAIEPVAMNIRQLRRRVVPKIYQHVVIIAYHSAPLAGHVGLYKTYFRIATRYWWPGMYTDIREAVTKCAHCALTNATSHNSQQILHALSFDVPFDVISMDIWDPGRTTTKFNESKVLTCLDAMTGFASADFLKAEQINSDQVSRRAFAAFFIPNGLPKLILLDQGSENKGHLINMCTMLGINFHVIAPDQHNGILCERFHRYLNKVQKINTADTQSFTQWVQGTLFAVYAWNASPIDGTNIMRSFAAKARVFPFPIEVKEDHVNRIPPTEGEAAIEHIESIFPLWFKQQMLLTILQERRRERHREMRNQGIIPRKFNIGDIVLVQKQVQTHTVNEVTHPAKQQIAKFKGPYKVIEKLSENSYLAQKMPTIQGKGNPGKPLKFSAANMTKIPSTLILHKRLQEQDTRLAELERPLVHNPLEQAIGLHSFGRYVQAPDQTKFVFDKVEDLWNEPLDTDSEEEDNGVEEVQDASMVEESGETGGDSTQQPSETPDTQMDEETPRDESETNSQEDSPRRSKRQKVQSSIQLAKEMATKSHLSLEELYNSTRDSLCKLFFIKEKQDWWLVRVDWNKTLKAEALNQGIYHVKWYVRNEPDSRKLPMKECRYWPMIQKFRNGSFCEGAIMIKPQKWEEMISNSDESQLNVGQYQRKINLFEQRLVGPFEFSAINHKPYGVADEMWKALVKQAQCRGIAATNITEIHPLDSVSRERPTKRRKATESSSSSSQK
jgi:RNase H-like domain found in reverse transcriptase/Integrase zinc binding domain/Reverse transcriptase (RNA-dependent DNA polymerase)